MIKRILFGLLFLIAVPQIHATATLIQHPYTVCASSTSVCTVGLHQNTGTGNIINIMVTIKGGNATISAVSGGGTYTHCSNCAATNTNSIDDSYTLSSTSGAASIQVTLSNGTNSGWIVSVEEWAGSNLSLDVSGSQTSSSTTPPGVTLTLTATDIVIQGISASSSTVPLITGGAFASPAFADYLYQAAFAGVANTTNGAAPTWVNGVSTSLAMAAIAFKESGGTPPAGKTWYIRSDGGTRGAGGLLNGQCNGLSDAAYVSGVNQPCAFNDYRYLFTEATYSDVGWVISGGDTIILRNGPWRVGFDGPNSGDKFGGWNPGTPTTSYNPHIPPGTSGTHTRILGENWATCGANNKTQVFGGFSTGTTIDISGAQYLDIRCLELTDHAQCIRLGAGAPGVACSSSFPVDDYASTGMFTDNTTANILLQDLNIHGFTGRAIIGPIGGTFTVTNVRMAYNGAAGWDFDDGSSTASVNGVVNATNLVVEWNGCNEEYPITHTYSALVCYDQNSAGYGDGIGTPSTPLQFTCTLCIFRYNTQDGLDLLHATTGPFLVQQNQSYGNMGQQYKLGGAASVSLINSLAVTNCNRMSAAIGDVPSSFNTNLSNYCRAAGDGIAISLINNGVIKLQFNSIVGYSATTIDIGGSCGCTGYALTLQDNIFLGYSNPVYQSGVTPGFIFWGDTANYGSRDHNIIFNMRNTGCPTTGFTAENCADPLFVSEPALTMAAESDLDNFNFNISAGSPANGTGITIGGITVDFNGILRSNPPSIGALEFNTSNPNAGSTIPSGVTLLGVTVR